MADTEREAVVRERQYWELQVCTWRQATHESFLAPDLPYSHLQNVQPIALSMFSESQLLTLEGMCRWELLTALLHHPGFGKNTFTS